MTKCRLEEEENYTRFNSTNSHSQFDAFDRFAFGDKRATSIAITLNIRKIIHNKRFAIKKLTITRFHTNETI